MADLKISITQFKISSIESIVPPNSPRSLRACAAEGIDPSDLRFVPRSVFELHELKENPIKKPNFDKRVALRHAAHLKSLKNDLRRVQKRFLKLRKVALRKQEISKNNKMRILSQKADNDRKKLAGDEEIQQILDTLGIDPSNPPQWLDLDGDGDISMEELKPMKHMMEKMVDEQKRQERSMKIKLTQQIHKVKQEEKEMEQRKIDDLKRDKVKLLEMKKRRQREQSKIIQMQQEEEEAAEKQLMHEKKAKIKFRKQHEQLLLEKQDLQRKTHLKNVLQKQQEDQRRIETVQRAKNRKFKEQLKIDKADAKWEEIETSRKKELARIIQLRRDTQLKLKHRMIKRKILMEKEELKHHKKMKKIEADMTSRIENNLIRREKKRIKKIKKHNQQVLIQIEKKEACFVKIQLQRKEKKKKFYAKQKELKQRRQAQHQETVLKIEHTKLENHLKYKQAHLNAKRQKDAKSKKMNWVHSKTEEKHLRLARLKAQKKGIDQHAYQVRRNMELRKEGINQVVKDATTNDNNWGKAEKLLNTIANGPKNSPMARSPRTKSPKRPDKDDNRTEDKSPRHQRHLLSNPHLGDALDSRHASELRGRKRGGRGHLDVPCPPNVLRMRRARKWMNLSARRFESIFGRVDERHNDLTNMYRGLNV